MPNLSSAMSEKINVNIQNYSAFPILVHGYCHYVVVMCNRKMEDQGSKQLLTFDEMKLVNFITYSF